MKIKKYFKILFIILAILLVCLIIFVMNIEEKTESNHHLGSYEIEMTEQSVSTENFDEILNLLPIKSIDMRERTQNFTLIFLKAAHKGREYTEEELEYYYESNKEVVQYYLSESSLKDYKQLVEELKKIETSELKLTNCIFYPDTLEEKDKLYKFKMQITYNETYKFDFIVHVNTTNSTNIKFEFVK